MGELQGKVAIITGASRGIGAATARAMAAEGAALALVARSGGAIDALAAEIGEAGGRAIAIPADVADYAAMEAAIARTRETFGRLDAVIANAAIIDPIGAIAATDPEEWARALAINVGGVYNIVRAALPVLLAGGGGTVISIGSGAAQNPLEGWSAYCSTKAAILMFARCLHHELKGKGIRVFSLSPGTIATDMQRAIKASGINPVSRMDFADHAPPEHPARALVWLCTPAADPLAGTELSLRDPDFRARIGLA